MNGLYTVTFCVIFQFLTMFNTIVGARAVGAGAASRYGSYSDQMMWFLAAPALQNCVLEQISPKKISRRNLTKNLFRSGSGSGRFRNADADSEKNMKYVYFSKMR
jgi:hypothetical protein